MSIPQKKKTDFEQVDCGDFVNGTIVEVQEDLEHKFTFKGEEKIKPAVRFIFELEGYEFKHYSRWMYFGYSERATLYAKYITALVENPEIDMAFDIQNLSGMKVKTLWKDETNGWQSIETIRPVGGKLKWTAGKADEPDSIEPAFEPVGADEETPDVPF